MKRNSLFIVVGVILLGATIVFSKSHAEPKLAQQAEVEPEIIYNEPQPVVKKIEITSGSTFGKLLEQAGISATTAQEIFTAAETHYDLSKIREGRVIELTYDPAGTNLQRLLYQIDNESEIIVTLENGKWLAELNIIEYEVRERVVSGEVESSMYQAAVDQNIDIRAIIEMANAFQWSVDFAMNVQKGDTFKFIYEERYRHGEYVMPGKVIAGKFVNNGKEHYVFHFEESEDNIGFFDEQGNSVQKMFLKAPLEYRYISSGFTTGLRYVAAFNVSTGHRAIDYAAAMGTPVRAVGDGTVTLAGWDGSYGNKISIRHNGTYSTNYAHLSKFAIKRNQHVSQGQVIGYVGSTGFSTGPHLHYEMVKDGVKINPLYEVQPPGKPISEDKRTEFDQLVAQLKQTLDS